MELIRKYFEKTHKISEEDWQLFESKLIKNEFSKRQVVLSSGQVERHLSFVEKGILRLYIPNEENELTFAFVFDNFFISAYDSFLTQTPSLYTIETITETTLWQISYNSLQEIYQKTQVGNLFGRLASEDLFLKKAKREQSLLSQSAEQRYINLFKEQPQLIEKIPLKYIASYIGVTPQALSRIRKRI